MKGFHILVLVTWCTNGNGSSVVESGSSGFSGVQQKMRDHGLFSERAGVFQQNGIRAAAAVINHQKTQNSQKV